MVRGDRLAIVLDFEQQYRLPAYHLRRVDHLSMASSVEVRVPYCQPRVAGFARQLSADLKISEGRVKRVLYAAAAGRLPESILTRPKQPFTLPIAAMMRAGQPLYEFIADVLDPSTIRSREIFNPSAIAALLRRQREAPDAHTALTLWSLMIFELWMQQFSVIPSIDAYARCMEV
jgi:asparagine synthase (glutamine-hydrolysing)